MKYLATFVGRTRGAIGIFYPISTEVEAETPEAAELKLYDTHEHIQGLRFVELNSEDARERIECTRPGTPGHHGCGLCLAHNKLRAECGCLLWK